MLGYSIHRVEENEYGLQAEREWLHRSDLLIRWLISVVPTHPKSEKMGT